MLRPLPGGSAARLDALKFDPAPYDSDTMAAILTGLVASWMSRRLQLVALGLACVAMLAVALRVAALMDTSKLLA